MIPVTKEEFEEWKTSSVTQKFLRTLDSERERMKEGLVNGNFEQEAMVKGRCQAIALILDVTYEDLYEPRKL
jgi:hypothetical protein